MNTGDVLERGRESFHRKVWGDAHSLLSTADSQSPLGPEDLNLLAVASFLISRNDDSADMWARAHQEYIRLGNPTRAARCAFWLGLSLLIRGEFAQGGGWIARAHRILDEGQHDCVERGYLLVPDALQILSGGDADAAHDTFLRAGEIGVRFGDPDLVVLSRLGRGQALIRLGKAAEGVTLLDEAMVAVTAGEVSPIPSGIVYCAVILACQEIFDLRRAREWTDALSRWCETQPDLVPFRGQCLVHRSEIIQMRGEWDHALEEVQLACERLSQPQGQAALGMAFYQKGELHRLRGDFPEAEESYRQASEYGHTPQPGMALLRLAQGQAEAAAVSISLALDETQDRITRSKLLTANVEIAISTGDVQAARTTADELSGIAAEVDAPLLYAISGFALGSVLLAEGEARAALTALRRAWTICQELVTPYEAARVRVLMALACRELGDQDTAEIETAAACRVFRDLGATPDLARVEALSNTSKSQPSGGLTPREIQVIRLLAQGRTNRAIAGELVISEKTVARHVNNIYTKLSLSSRSAATAYAYQNDLL
ncbi:MAG: DNA-binding response regulator [Chloroflexi bacterium]|nr:DNA-binding response regulator [Chloroflexota bacterium]